MSIEETRVITGFHAIEEKIKSLQSLSIPASNCALKIGKTGPRAKKIIELAKSLGIEVSNVSKVELDELVKDLPVAIQDHRGIVLTVKEVLGNNKNFVNLDSFCKEKMDFSGNSLVVVLDSVTDPYNLGAIMRSCDQFGVDLLVIPERRGAKDGEVVDRASAGASSWLPISVVPNLVHSVEKIKDSGYWIYGADAGGKTASSLKLSGKTVLVMGSEGTGISRLLGEKCDEVISIPTCGKIDSLNVSVAAGILLYEVHRQNTVL